MTRDQPHPPPGLPFVGGVAVGHDHSVFGLTSSPGLPGWLHRQGVSLAFTTYQAGRLFTVGRSPDGGLSVFQRAFERCMGLWAAPDGQSFWMATQWQLWRFANALAPGITHNGYDRLYIPRTGHTTGDLDIHDLAVAADAQVVFVNTHFGCLATLSAAHSFRPLWRPPFISGLVPEDRCHLNGLAMAGGRPRYVTAVSTSDVLDGWRQQRGDGGVVIDVDSGAVVAAGLSMPHSPRVYRDRVWLLNAGTGHLGYLEAGTGRFVPVTFLPGFARGLSFTGDYALVGLSAARTEFSFEGLALPAQLAKHQAEAQCGLVVVELATGRVVEWLRIDGAVRELYDVVLLPGVVRPMVLGTVTPEVRQILSIEGA
jgi:uncharacterized protein (TIGR03032 family)